MHATHLEVSRETLHQHLGLERFDVLHCAGKVPRATVGQFIAVNAGQHHVTHAPRGHCARCSFGLRGVQGRGRATGLREWSVLFLEHKSRARTFTAQNRQPLVHVSPINITVAVLVPSLPPQHSPILGQRASSHTVFSCAG